VDTDNKFTAGVRHDWLNPGQRWFWFVDGRYDFDDFQSWTHRIAGHGGAGYHLLQDEKMTLDILGGAGFRKEFGSENDDIIPEGLLGLDYTWRMTSRQNFVASVRYLPSLTELEDYRTRSSLEWRYVLEQELALTLSAGLLHEYQNVVDPGKDRNDLRVWIGMGLTY
jgi:putative salt-induced outer membrane protein YdiY